MIFMIIVKGTALNKVKYFSQNLDLLDVLLLHVLDNISNFFGYSVYVELNRMLNRSTPIQEN